MFDEKAAFDELNSYNTLEWNIGRLVNNLNNAIENLEKADYSVRKYILIDDSNSDNNDIRNLKNTLVSYRDYLANTCKSAAGRNKQRMIDTIEGEGITIEWS